MHRETGLRWTLVVMKANVAVVDKIRLTDVIAFSRLMEACGVIIPSDFKNWKRVFESFPGAKLT